MIGRVVLIASVVLLPFSCKFVDGEWRNSESGSTVQAAVVGWRLPRFERS